MPNIEPLIVWFSSGSGRIVAGAILFTLIWALKSLPGARAWLNRGDGRLTADRKKLLANLVLASAPLAAALVDAQRPLAEVFVTALEAALVAMGIHGGLKAARSGGSGASG